MATKKKKTVKKKAPKKAAKAKKAVKKAPSKPKKKSAVKKKAPVQKKSPVKKKAAASKKKPARPKKKAAASKKKAAPSKKKAVAKKKPAAKKSTAKKPAAKKAVAKAKPVKRLPPPAPFAPSRLAARTPPKRKRNIKKLTAKELKEFRQSLLNLRDKVVDGIAFLSGDNLNRSQRDASGDLSGYSLHMADQGTDNYDREFALNLVSSEQDILYEIDEAIRRIDDGKYGLCELTGEPIERARLKVIPYARYSVTAQSEIEKGKTRYRPFGPTLTHGG